MRRLRELRRQMFDIRPGEHRRTWAMFAYLLFVLFAYYIVKPVSRSMFLTTFDVDKLPSLYILIAIFGGILAYLYSKLAAKASLRFAVLTAMALSVISLVVMWWLIRLRLPWMIYVLNIWVSLFSVVAVSQGWLVASNLFDNRQAKRLYPLLGLGMVAGAAFGGEFTSRTALLVGTQNLLLASALMVVFAYVSFRLAIWRSESTVKQASAAQEGETDFSFSQMMRDLVRVKHLRIIIGMMVVMYLVDTLVEYQFQAMARGAFRGDHLTAFFGQFYGIYLNGVEFVFQIFLTAAVVHWFGVGGTLHISPVAIVFSSIGVIAGPGVASASAVRLVEASTRYTLNKTGMELLYMPLPLALRNRIKAFIDICVDRLSRGIGGVLLLLLTTTSLHMGVKGIAIVVVGLCIPWIWFSHVAKKEYVATIRRRLESRRLDLESVRVAVNDSDTIRLLEAAAESQNPRQATYAIGLLAETHGYDVRPLLRRLSTSPLTPLRAKVYEVAERQRWDGLLAQALREVQAAQAGGDALTTAITYALTVSPDRARLAAKLLNDANPVIAMAAVEALRSDRDLARQLIMPDWLDGMAAAPDPRRRALAAKAIGAGASESAGVLHFLLSDEDPEVGAAACQAAGEIQDRAFVPLLIHALNNVRLRREAIPALARFGPAICEDLAAVLLDETASLRVRLQVTRVFRHIPHQRSVDALLTAISHQDLAIRAGVLKALNSLRRKSPELNFDDTFVTRQILAEARYYYQLNAALAPFRQDGHPDLPAARLLARSLEERLVGTLERLFRLLGLRYPPKEIYSAYLAISQKREAETAAALEFLDNVLDRSLKRVLLPLLDAPEHLLERGRDLFGLEVPSAEEAIRELIHSGDSWLGACAMAAAAELRFYDLAPDIAKAAESAAGDVVQVARSAALALAPSGLESRHA